jgi:hypothetical protein
LELWRGSKATKLKRQNVIEFSFEKFFQSKLVINISGLVQNHFQIHFKALEKKTSR